MVASHACDTLDNAQWHMCEIWTGLVLILYSYNYIDLAVAGC